MSGLGRFFDLNRRASRAVDRALPAAARVDGNRTFRETVPTWVARPGAKVYDIGGGSRPAVSPEVKARFGLTCVGLDIEAEELSKAPPGGYDETIVADICTFRGRQDGDVVLCQAVLEHVEDAGKAIEGLVSLLRPGGELHIFVPCRNAAFARLNLALPQQAKIRLLHTVSPTEDVIEHQGFPVRYDRCTPRDFRAELAALGCSDIRIRTFWMSTYFFAFLPAYVAWRAWQGVARAVLRENGAETFIASARAPVDRPTEPQR